MKYCYYIGGKRKFILRELLEVEYSSLTYHLYRCSFSEKYITFEIPKRAGGSRIIKAPVSPIKIIQSKLNKILQEVYKHRQSVHGKKSR